MCKMVKKMLYFDYKNGKCVNRIYYLRVIEYI